MENRTEKYTIYISALIISLAYAISVLLDIKQLWGFNPAKFLPAWWQWLTIIIAAVFLIPSVSRKILTWLENGSRAITENSKREIAFVIITAVVLLPLWLIFNSRGFFLGDATVRLNWIAGGILWVPTEPGDYFIHAIIDYLILKPLNYSVALSYHIVSAASGILFIIGAYRLARYLKREQVLVIFILLITSSLTVMFFGYIESYSIIAALLPFLVLSALKVIDGNSHLVVFIVLFFISAIMHTMTMIIFSGLLLMVTVLPRVDDLQSKRLNIGLSVLIALGLVTAYLFQAIGFMPTTRYILALFPSDNYRQGFFTANHLLNLCNWIALAGLSGMVLLIVTLFKKQNTGSGDSKRKSLVLWMVLPSLLFLLFFKPQLGGPRDWDLFAPAAFMLIPAGVTYHFARVKNSLPSSIIPVAGISLFILISFAAVNNSLTRATDRFCEIIEVSKFKNLFKEYGMLYEFAKNTPELEHRTLEFGLKAWEQPAYNKADSSFMAKRLAVLYLGAHDARNSLNFLQLSLQADSTDLETYFKFNEYCRTFEQPEKLSGLARDMMRLFPNNREALLSAGMTFQEIGQLDRAGEAFNRAYELSPDDPMTILNMGKYLFDIGDYDNSVKMFERISRSDPFAFYAFYYKADAWNKIGNRAQALQSFEIATQLAQSNEYKQMLVNLKRALQIP